MNINIIINNYTFIKRNNAINHIKKLLVYYVNYINRHFSSDKLSVKFYKINYSLEENKLTEIQVNFNNGIESMINDIININYKLYDTENVTKINEINNKNILNKINEIIKIKNHKIFLITSMPTSFENNEFFRNVENVPDITYLNITNADNYLFVENKNLIHFYHKNQFSKLYKKDIFVPSSNYDVTLTLINEKINSFKETEEINANNLSTYIYLLELIDAKLNTNNNDELNCDEFYHIVKKILSININVNNSEIINNLIKNFQKNIIFDIIEHLSCYKKIDIVSDDTISNMENIILCVDFYQKNYSHNNFTLNNKKIKTENKQIILNKMTGSTINNININLSKFTTSSLTLSNIYDEYNDSNIYGFLINYKNTTNGNLNKFKNNLVNIKKYPEINCLKNVIIEWMSICDYYELSLINFDANKQLSVKNTSIKNDAYGETNSMLPIYFNKHHWKLFKSISSHHFSFINDIHESQYDKNYDNIYFITLLKTFSYINFNIKRKQNEYIQLFTYVLRTCIQIMQENKYNCSMENKFEIFINGLNKDNYLENISNLMIRSIQYIVFNGIQNLTEIFEKITKMFVDDFIKTEINMGFWSDENLNKKDFIDTALYEHIHGWLCLKTDLLKMAYFVKKIYEYSGFNRFIKEIDKNDGFLEVSNSSSNIINCEQLIKSSNEINNKINFETILNNIKIQFFPKIYNKYNINNDNDNDNDNDKISEKWNDIRSAKEYNENLSQGINVVNNDPWEDDFNDDEDEAPLPAPAENNNWLRAAQRGQNIL
jgi:hypothetical protein